MSFGISPAPEEFQKRIDEALEGLEGIKAIHDDILIWGSGDNDVQALEDHAMKLRALFERCREKNIKLNKEKLRLRQKEVSFMGHVISADGLKVDNSKIVAIIEMPKPTDKKGVQRLLGMVNYVQKFAPGLSSATEPLRQLIKEDSEFYWDAVHDECLSGIKDILSSVPVLKYFDTAKQAVLQCDASEAGLGACLIQECHPIVYASRALTTAERNYAQIEKELLAIVFVVERFEHYVYGRKVIVESDHKPLEIIHKKSLVSAPKRLQRMLLKLQKFDIEISYKPGPEMYIADALSRAYLPTAEKDRSFTEKEVEHVNMIGLLPIARERIKEIQRQTSQDVQLQSLMKVVKFGWPEDKHMLLDEVRSFYAFREEMLDRLHSSHIGIQGCGDKHMLLDEVRSFYAFREEMLDRLHSSHIGIQGCLRRARETVYWPNMNSEVENYIQLYDVCNTFGTHQQKETLQSHEIPSRPWEVIGTDLFQFDNRDFVITVDYYSNFFEVDKLESKTSKGVIPKLKRYGIPERLISDNGPPFSGKEFADFSREYEFKHITSSPGYPQSNGRVENAVKTAKKYSGSDPHLALLDFRNTHTEGVGVSPAQAMFGRSTRTLLSIAKTQLMPAEKDAVKHKGLLYENKMKQARNCNKYAKDMETLSTGDTVRVKPMAHSKLWRKARVEEHVGLRSYTVRTEDDSVYRRNRRHLGKTNEPVQLHEDYTEQDEDTPIEIEHVNRHTQIFANKFDDITAPAATQGIDMQTIILEKFTTPRKQIEEGRQTPTASERRYPQRTKKKPDRLAL